MKDAPVIAIQKKGNLTRESKKLLLNLGMDIERKRNRRDFIETDQARVLLLRYEDIIRAVSNRFADLGIAGSDSVFDVKNEKLNYIDLPFGYCRIALAVRDDSSYYNAKDLNDKVVATGFTKISFDYFDILGVKPKLYYTQGSTEMFCSLGFADAIVDITNTGKSLKANGLRVIDTIQKINAVLIYRKGYNNALLNKIKEYINEIK